MRKRYLTLFGQGTFLSSGTVCALCSGSCGYAFECSGFMLSLIFHKTDLVPFLFPFKKAGRPVALSASAFIMLLGVIEPAVRGS